MRTAAVYTLGCKVNQVESEALIEELTRHGYTVVPDGAPAGLCIINTCSVTSTSDRKSRSLIRRIARANPGARVVVTGCLAETAPEAAAAIEGVDLVAGNRVKERLVELIDDQPRDCARHLIIAPPEGECAPPLPRILYNSPHRRTRAFIKIADGCESRCSYCIIPSARGPVRSKRPEDVLAEIDQLVTLGYREIVLTGINIGYYGRDWPESLGLDALLEQVFQAVGSDCRLRIGSVNPREINAELLAMMSRESRFCRHLHIPLQSGSDRVLHSMGRGYTGAFFASLVREAVLLIPGIGITTDVMVGYPGEKDEEFKATYDLLASLPLLDMHVFRYSPRPGTPAAAMAGQVAEEIKESRSRSLIDLARDKHRQFLLGMQGQKWTVLVERSCGPGIYRAISDNYVEMCLHSSRDLTGCLVDVTVSGKGPDGLIQAELL